jgi:hypothetical protein
MSESPSVQSSASASEEPEGTRANNYNGGKMSDAAQIFAIFGAVCIVLLLNLPRRNGGAK